MWPTYEELPPIHPSTLSAMLGLVGSWSRAWGTKIRILQRVAKEPGGDWCYTAEVANFLGMSTGRARKLLNELDVVHNAIWRDGGGGGRCFWVEVNPDLTAWRHVPWRIRTDEGSAAPEVRRRLSTVWLPVDDWELRAAIHRLIARPKGARCEFGIARSKGARSALEAETASRALRARDDTPASRAARHPYRAPYGRAMPNPGSRENPGVSRDADRVAPSSSLSTGDDHLLLTGNGHSQGAAADPNLLAQAAAIIKKRASPKEPGVPNRIWGKAEALLVALVRDHGKAVVALAAEFPSDRGVWLAVLWIAEQLRAAPPDALGLELDELVEDVHAARRYYLQGEVARIRNHLRIEGLDPDEERSFLAELAECQNELAGLESRKVASQA